MNHTSDASRQYRMDSSVPQYATNASSSRPAFVHGATHREETASAVQSSAVPSNFEPVVTAVGPFGRR